MKIEIPNYITTAKFAEINFVKPCTDQRRHSLTAQYLVVIVNNKFKTS